MRIEQLKQSMASNISPIYLIEGEDAFLRESALKQIQDKCLVSPQLNLNIFNGSYVSENVDGFVESLMIYPFMSEKRVVIVREYYPTATQLKNKAIDNYLKNPSSTTVLIIVNENANEQLKKYESVCVVNCGKADLSTIVKYIQVTLKRENLIITVDNAKTICEYCQYDMTRIFSEVEKLVSFCSGNCEITKSDIDQIVVRESDYQIYEMTEQIANSNFNKAYDILTDMLSKNKDGVRLFSNIYYYFRRLFFCSISNETNGELAKKFGCKEYAVLKSREQAKKFSAKKLKEYIDMFSRYDTMFKTGEINDSDALTISVFKIMCR